MEEGGALAALVGRRSHFFITQTAISLGRSSGDGSTPVCPIISCYILSSCIHIINIIITLRQDILLGFVLGASACFIA